MADRPIDDMCDSKKRGHRCIRPKGHSDSKEVRHECFCHEKWEEVTT